MITLFQFQEAAAATISSRVNAYLDNPLSVTVRKSEKHAVPYFQALSAVTGAGKTVILAEAVAQVADSMPLPPVIMWLSRGKVVVDQSFANLSPGGKYHQFLDSMTVLALAEYSPVVVAESARPLVYFATVGTFNQKDKEDGSLRVHKSDVDNMERSVWDALRQRTDTSGVRRPLVVVYDEAQNLSDQQTELLLELEPEALLVASATMKLPARLASEVEHLKRAGYSDGDLITKVPTSEVVVAGLIKETVLLEGYNSPMEETIEGMLDALKETREEANNAGISLRPKAIYVCNTNVVADNPNLTDSPKQPFAQRQAPPILIWRYLVEELQVDPSTVAVYADLKTDKSFPLPGDFILFKGGDKDYSDFTSGSYQHVIFNLTLQEGWDDPAVYFAYIDKSMGSRAQITQVIGRVLRQPGATHYSGERLNTAHFYVRVDKNAVFNEVVEQVQAELGTSTGGVRIVVSRPDKPKPRSYMPSAAFEVPQTALDPSNGRESVSALVDDFPDFRDDAVNTRGVGSRRTLKQLVGNSGTASDWASFEQASHASARWILYREIQRQFKPALGIVNMAVSKFDAVLGINSPAHKQLSKLADEIVDAYIKGVRIKQRLSNPYRVGSVLGDPDSLKPYDNAIHGGYSGFNGLERVFAASLDAGGFPWCKNPPRTGFGIPLISVGSTTAFYPDFLVWTENRVVCVDTKGQHLIRETAARKLLRLKYNGTGRRIDIQFVSEGKYGPDLELKSGDGYTVWGLTESGTVSVVHYEELRPLVNQLLDDSRHED